MSRRVILPARLFRQWDRLALLQLTEAAVRFHEENEDLSRRCARAEETANDCWEQAMDLQLQLCEVTHQEPGLTRNGELVLVDRQLPLDVEWTATNHDWQQQYARDVGVRATGEI